MAAHITCHQNDILPNTFPPPKPTMKDHGFVSQYEQTYFMKTMGDPSFLEEEGHLDSVPSLRKPQPIQTFRTTLPTANPSLCLTPDKRPPAGENRTKTSGSKQKQLYSPMKYESDSDSNLTSTGKSTRVQFDPIVDVKHMSPEVHAVDSDVSIVEVGKLDDTLSDSQEMNEFHDQQSENLTEKKSVMPNASNYPSLPEVGLNTKKSVPSSYAVDSKQNFISGNGIKDKPTASDTLKTEGFEPIHIPYTSQIEHVLARPEFNSTLAKVKELEKLKESELNLAAELEKTLKTSDVLRNNIEEKAYSKVNVQSDAFNNLTSVDVQVEDLLRKKEKQSALSVKPPKKHKHKHKPEPTRNVPDVMEYFSAALQHETASYTLPGLSTPSFTPQTAPLDKAFDMYRHIRAWEQLD